jgi:hypothetical protein
MKTDDIAKAVRQELDAAMAIGLPYRAEGVVRVAMSLADSLQKRLPNFDRQAFLDACGVPNV